jgi:hypothetical protein
LPDDHYRQLWQQMQAQFDSYTAARLMTEALYIMMYPENWTEG